MSENREETVRKFCDVTGADETRSKFFLESSNWRLEEAISSFFEHGGNVEEPSSHPGSAPSVPVLSDSDMDSPAESPQRTKKQIKKPNLKFATLDSLHQEESSSDEEEGQAFYAGGSERSGQQIIGPGKGRRDIVSEVFKSVKERNAVVFEDEPASSSRGRGGVFGGTGYRLGQTADDHEAVGEGATQAQNEARSVRLRLYREGFSVDNGPLRSYTDPEHSEFLNYIRRGEIPPSLAGTGEVRVSLEDRRHEECPRNVCKPPSFQGKGQMLGSPTPPTVGATVPIATATEDSAANQRAAQEAVQLDESQPTTTIQFRLADGSRITGRFNHTHTVADLRQYVSRAVPAYQMTTFALLTSFPSRELEEPTATVASANILNSTLLQRLK